MADEADETEKERKSVNFPDHRRNSRSEPEPDQSKCLGKTRSGWSKVYTLTRTELMFCLIFIIIYRVVT